MDNIGFHQNGFILKNSIQEFRIKAAGKMRFAKKGFRG